MRIIFVHGFPCTKFGLEDLAANGLAYGSQSIKLGFGKAGTRAWQVTLRKSLTAESLDSAR